MVSTPTRRATPRTSEEGDSEGTERLQEARRAMLEGVGAEIAASFPGITRLGGQIVAALYLDDAPRSMDELSEDLGRSKSNIFTNLKALEAAGIVERRRSAGARHDVFALRGPYPDVIIGAYVSRLRRVVADKRALTERALRILGDAKGTDADVMRTRLRELQRKYELFGKMFALLGVDFDGPFDLEAVLTAIPLTTLQAFAKLAREAMGAFAQIAHGDERGRRKP